MQGGWEYGRTFRVGSEVHTHLSKDQAKKTVVTDLENGKAREVNGWTPPPATDKISSKKKGMGHLISFADLKGKGKGMGLLSPVTSPVDTAETMVGVAGIGGTMLFFLSPVAARDLIGKLAHSGVEIFKEGRATIMRPENIARAKTVLGAVKKAGGTLARVVRH